MINLDNKKILLVRNDNIGDLICTTPAIEALRKRYPTSQIDIVVNSYNYSAIYNNPFVDNILCYTKTKHEYKFIKKIKAIIKKIYLYQRIKQNNYYAVIVFRSGYSKSAESFSNISNAKYRVGVKDLQHNKDNFNIHIDTYNHKHEVEFCFDCLSIFNVLYDNEKTYYYTSIDKANKYKKYSNHILFHISSRLDDNKLSFNKFIKIINTLEYKKVLISSEGIDFNNALNIADNTVARFIQTSSLDDLAALIKNVKILVTLDGGAMHVGPAVGTKTIAISGKTNMSKWHPWGYRHLVVSDKSKVANNIQISKIVGTIRSNT